MSNNNLMENKTGLQKFGDKINAIPLWGKIVIVVACCLLDTVTCVLLLVGSFIFVKAGSKGMGIALMLCNIVMPDALPFVDEIFNVIVVAIPMIKEYQQSKDLKKTLQAGMDSHSEYQSAREKVNNTISSSSDNYDEE